MAVYAIGDIQGCYDQLVQLLEKIKYNDHRDRLWFTGDLVNRGPRSLQTLRMIQAMGANATVVLGNHDLHPWQQLTSISRLAGKTPWTTYWPPRTVNSCSPGCETGP